MRVYLDSNVLISFLRSEIDGAFNLRFQQAADFFSFCRTKKIRLVLSDFFFSEVEKIFFLDKASAMEIFRQQQIPFEKIRDAPDGITTRIFQK